MELKHSTNHLALKKLISTNVSSHIPVISKHPWIKHIFNMESNKVGDILGRISTLLAVCFNKDNLLNIILVKCVKKFPKVHKHAVLKLLTWVQLLPEPLHLQY